MDRAELARQIGRRCRLTGTFTLRSGAVASTYFDKFRFEGDPTLLRAVAEQMAPLVPAGTEVLAGLEMGGVPVAAALSLETGIPAAYVRKVPKAYGTQKLAEGSDIDGARVLVVEDVISTGGQVVASTGDLRARGAVVDQVLVVIDRTPDRHDELTAASLEVHSLFTEVELG